MTFEPTPEMIAEAEFEAYEHERSLGYTPQDTRHWLLRDVNRRLHDAIQGAIEAEKFIEPEQGRIRGLMAKAKTPEEIEARLADLRAQRRTSTNLKRINREIADLTERLAAAQPQVDAAPESDYPVEPVGSAGAPPEALTPEAVRAPEPATTPPAEIRTKAGAPFRSIGQAKQAVRARGESFRSEHDKQSKIEAEARRVAAEIDGDYAYLMERVADWPGQEMAFLDAVENTGNYEVLPWDHPTHTGSCTCFQWSPCSFCYTNDYWIDWRAGK